MKENEKELEKRGFMRYVAAVMASEIAKTIYGEFATANRKFGKFSTSDVVIIIADAIAQTVDAMSDVFNIDKESLAELLCNAIKKIVKINKDNEDEKEN